MSTTDRRNQPKIIAFEDQLWHDLLAENWFSPNYDGQGSKRFILQSKKTCESNGNRERGT
jgi:hypothetical protein